MVLVIQCASSDKSVHLLACSVAKNGNLTGIQKVATEYNWDREEFLRQTCIKAGLYKNAWKDKNAEIYTFQTQIISE